MMLEKAHRSVLQEFLFFVKCFDDSARAQSAGDGVVLGETRCCKHEALLAPMRLSSSSKLEVSVNLNNHEHHHHLFIKLEIVGFLEAAMDIPRVSNVFLLHGST